MPGCESMGRKPKLVRGRGWIDVREVSGMEALGSGPLYGWFRVPGSIEVWYCMVLTAPGWFGQSPMGGLKMTLWLYPSHWRLDLMQFAQVGLSSPHFMRRFLQVRHPVFVLFLILGFGAAAVVPGTSSAPPDDGPAAWTFDMLREDEDIKRGGETSLQECLAGLRVEAGCRSYQGVVGGGVLRRGGGGGGRSEARSSQARGRSSVMDQSVV